MKTGLLFSYSFRNLLARRLTTTLTGSGMALVVFVFASIVMLAEGLKKTLVDTGSPDNVIVLRRSAGSEVQSGIERNQASIVETQPEIAMGNNGKRLIAKEMVVLITLQKRETESPANVVIRGISESSLEMRTQVKLIMGRLPRPGSSEIMTGRNIAERFEGAGIGQTLFFGMRSWARGRCVRRREHGIQLRALGRRGSTDAGLSKAGLFVGHFQTGCPLGL